MIYLLDVNVLLALGYEEHVHHPRAEQWFNTLQMAANSATLATCAITELGFVRVATSKAALAENVNLAREDLKRLKTKKSFVFLNDWLDVDRLPGWVEKSKHVTDGHLLALATVHRAPLVTLDTGIPGALLIPDQPESPLMIKEQPARYAVAA
jgi:uncharacterized protein